MNKLIGLIDEDWESRGKMTFPNLSLMKLAAWHRQQGDTVGWYSEIMGTFDRVYCSRVFSEEYTRPYSLPINAHEVVRGGSGYAITVTDGQEHYDKTKDPPLPPEIDHMYPVYDLYGIEDTAYGFLTKGCPRGCPFCHVAGIQGTRVTEFAPLSEFWHGQKEIKLLDPNLTASLKYEEHMADLARSGAWVDFTQGLDARMLNEARIEALNGVKFRRIHFAWDNPKDPLEAKFRLISKHLKRFAKERVSCYVLTNYNSTFEEDLYRVETLKSLRIQPYVMIYRKHTAPENVRRLQRYANNAFITWKIKSFEEYKR